MKLPKLFKRTATGALQEWSIHTENNDIVTTWGQSGGVIQQTRDVIQAGKNIGKSNQTSPVQQAEAEAKSR